MAKRTRRSPSSASHPPSARSRELTTKRRGELAELAFTLKAASLGFGVSRPFGDSERYDAIIDARALMPSARQRCHPTCPVVQAAKSRKAAKEIQKSTARVLCCPALRVLDLSTTRNPWCPPNPTAPLWRVQVKCSTQLSDGLYHLNAHRRTGGRAVPYLPGEIDFLAAFIIPEDTWYIIPLEAFLGSTSLLFRRRTDKKPGQYDEYKEAWHLLRPQ